MKTRSLWFSDGLDDPVEEEFGALPSGDWHGWVDGFDIICVLGVDVFETKREAQLALLERLAAKLAEVTKLLGGVP